MTHSPFDFYASRIPYHPVSYDGKEPYTQNVWEVKSRYRWWDLPGYKNLQGRVVDCFDEKMKKDKAIADACGLHYQWAVQNPVLADFLDERWKGNPPVHERR